MGNRTTDHHRVLLIDENDELLDGLTDWVQGSDGLVVVGRAHSCAEAMDRVDRLAPDLVLMDVTLGDGSGFELARAIKAGADAPLVVLMSFDHWGTVRIEALAAGADAWVSKAEVPEKLIPTLTALFRTSRADGPRPVAVCGISTPNDGPTEG